MYKPNGIDLTLFGSINGGLEKQQLRIDGFNALSEYVTKIGGSVGVKFKKGSVVQFNVQDLKDYMNSTRNRQFYSLKVQFDI